MSTLNEERAAEVVKALGSDVRLKILKELEKEPSRYNELMKRLKLDRRSDAGNFAFHLNKLLDAKLVELDKIEKKYKLTPLGNVALEYYRMLSDSSLGMDIMPDVRRSDMRIEKFDRQKIERALVEEAGMERSLASKISIEVQNRLLSSNVKMLTAPLIREFVNAVLIEQGLERYRAKLTRLGVPVYDVTRFLEERPQQAKTLLTLSGKEVASQYVLLISLPKDVADAHLSGHIHLSYLYDWVLRPMEVALNPVYHMRNKKIIRETPVNFKSDVEQEIAGLAYMSANSKDVSRALTLILDSEGIKEWRWFKKSIGAFLSSCEGKLSLNLRSGEKADEAGIENMMGDVIEIGKRSLLDSLFLVVNLNGIDESALRRFVVLATGIANLGGMVVLNVNKNEILMTYGGEILPILPKTQEDVVYLLGAATLNLPKISKTAKFKESRFFDLLRDNIQFIVKGFLVKQKAITSRLRDGILPALEAYESSIATFSQRAYSLVGLAGLIETAVLITEEQDISGSENLSMCNKMLSSAKATIRRESNGQHLNVFLTHKTELEAVERFSSMWREEFGDETFSKIQQMRPEEKNAIDMKLRQSICSLKNAYVNIDAVQNPEVEIVNLIKEGVELVEVGSRRNMCGECGSIVPWGMPICPYCGSRRKVKPEEFLG